MSRASQGSAIAVAALGVASGCSVYGIKDGWNARLIVGVLVAIFVAGYRDSLW